MRLKSLFVTFLGICAIFWTLRFDQPVSWNFGNFEPEIAGCGNDGTAYCNMARGLWAPSPYSRRILVPMIASAMPQTLPLPLRFKIINLAALLMIMVLTFFLTHRLSIDAASDNHRARWGALLAALILTLLPQFGFRWINFYPALVDTVANLLGLCWIMMIFARRSHLTMLAPVALLFASITRESWIPVGIISSFALFLAEPSSRLRMVAFLNLFSAIMSLVIIHHFDTVPAGYSPIVNSTWSAWTHQLYRAGELIHDHLFTSIGLQSTIWQTIFALGFLPWILIKGIRSFCIQLTPHSDTQRLVWFCLGVAGLNWTLGVVGTNDIHRITSASAPGIIAVIVAIVIQNPKLDSLLYWTLLISLAFWNPLSPLLDGTLDNYHVVFAPIFIEGETTPRLIRDLTRVLPLVAVWQIASLSRQKRLKT